MNCPFFCGAEETLESKQDPSEERPHYYECGTEPGQRGKQCLETELLQLRTALAECLDTSDTYKKYAENLRDQLDTSQAALAECQVREAEATYLLRQVETAFPLLKTVLEKLGLSGKEITSEMFRDVELFLASHPKTNKTLIPQAELDALRNLEDQVRHCRAYIIHDRIRQALSKLDGVREGK